MRVYSEAAMEKAMTRQEVILRAYAKKISWLQAAEILGVGDRQLRRIKLKYEESGFHALFDGRSGRISPRRIPLATVEEVLRLYREQYFDFNVRHFHEKLIEVHGLEVSYTWTKYLLQRAGLVKRTALANCIAADASADHCRECCSTLTAASITGSMMSDSMI
jgi:transposase